MALLLKKKIKSTTQLGIWKIEEEEEFFKNRLTIADADEKRLANMHNRRRKEWLAGRHLVSEFYHQRIMCEVDEYGKPFLPNTSIQISISHSREYAAAIADEQAVGIDIEKISSRITRIAHKFMREEEQDSLSSDFALEHLHIYWGAKEALYKAYGKKKLDFKAHIHVMPFAYLNSGTTTGTIAKGNYTAHFDIHFEKMGEYMLVYCIEK